MSKSFHSLIAGALMLGALPSAFAASSTDLTVTGNIIPGSCTPSLNRSNVDLGKISAADLNPVEYTQLTRQFLTLTINCTEKTLFGIKSADNRAGTADSKPTAPAPHGFGLTPDGEKIGGYHLSIRSESSTIDDKPAFLALSNPAGTAWGASISGFHVVRLDGSLVGLVDAVGVTSGPIPVKDAILNFNVGSYIAPANGLTLKDEVTLDGHATLSVVYL